MAPRVLAWYTSGVLAAAAVLVTFITVAPGGEGEVRTVFLVLTGAAAVFALVGWVLTNLPPEHRWNRSPLVRRALSVIAVLVTLLVLAVV